MKKAILYLLILLTFGCYSQKNKIDPNKNHSQNFTLTSAAFTNNGELPKLYSCDSTGISPTLKWSNAPVGTKSFAITMHHIAKDGETHVYFILYDIPVDILGIPDAVQGIGKFGTNTVNRRTSYTPPCSKGPGPKEYIITVYALSDMTAITKPGSAVTLNFLLDSIKNKILASSELRVIYSR